MKSNRMKAKIIVKDNKHFDYGEIVEVEKMEDTRFFANRYSVVGTEWAVFGDEIDLDYEKKAKEVEDFDWKAYRREVARDILVRLSGMAEYSNRSMKMRAVEDAMFMTDTLIGKLKHD